MQEKQTSISIFQLLSFAIFLFFLHYIQVSHLLEVFLISLVFSKKVILTNKQFLGNKLLVVLTLFILQALYPGDLGQSINTMQLLILSRKMLPIILMIFSSLLIYLFLYQDWFHLSYINPQNFTIDTIKTFKEKKYYYSSLLEENKDKMTRRNIKYLVSEIPRHGYINYTSRYNLADDFFERSKQAIQANNKLYIILSNTGSPASEMISLFTHKDFNHISLSFDEDLETMVSYNGGNEFQNPGLNIENLASLYQKEDSQIFVYSLKATQEQQETILNKIQQINMEGSAYNVIGLVAKVSLRPNMMFCSQFVYLMLQEVSLDFFEATETEVKPTDFIEKDYYGKLQFEHEIKFI